MTIFNKYELKEDLKNGVYTVTFEKVDGTIREMRCTLQSSHLPQMLTEETPRHQRPENEATLSVWDVDAGGWRSFRVDSIQTVVRES